MIPCEKEIFVVKCRDMKRATFWMKQFVEKFSDKVVSVKKRESLVELEDQIWFFRSVNSRADLRAVINAKVNELAEDDLVIIIDDIERTRLDSYEGDREDELHN